MNNSSLNIKQKIESKVYDTFKDMVLSMMVVNQKYLTKHLKLKFCFVDVYIYMLCN